VISGKDFNNTQILATKASSDVTVSGVSSGGFMSAQMLVAYSNDIKGAGLFASGPYFCTRGTMMTVVDCMTTGLSIVTDQLLLAAEGFQTLGMIDNLSNIKNSKVYLFSGTKDKVVWTPVVKKNEDFFRKLGAEIHADYAIGAEHCFPTDYFGNKCDKLGAPFINNCDFKGSKHALDHIMAAELQQQVDHKDSNLLSFDQSRYNPGMTSSFGDTGYIYIPDS
jgi:poly(3-hydroxybutyrate) depolymerase